MLRWSLGFVLVLIECKSIFGQWQYSQEFPSGMMLEWNYNEENMTMKITGPTQGWVGIGFAISHAMVEADLIIGGVRNNVPYVWDCYARRNGSITIDRMQNVEILQGVQNSTHTAITVRRPLVATESLDREITTGDITVMWAFGRLDKNGNPDLNDYRETNRGWMQFTLLKTGDDAMRTPDTGFTNTTSLSSSISPSEVISTSSPTTSPMTKYPSTVSSRRVIATRAQQVDSFEKESEMVSFPYTVTLDENQAITMRWDFDETMITIQLLAPTTGWIGIGFGRSPSMNGADLIMMGVNADDVYALDCHSERNGVPEVDEEQNVNIVSGWENGTHTAVTIRRKRLTCNEDDMDLRPGTYKVIWAYGQKDLTEEKLSFQYYHGRKNRGGRSLKIVNPVAYDFKKEEEEMAELHVDLGPKDFEVPPTSTHYLCKFVKVLEKDSTIFITGMKPYIKPGNEKYVHHIIIYVCDTDVAEEQLKMNYTCYEQVHPFSLGCNKILGGWAVGSTGIVFPESTGYPLGNSAHAQYIMVEMHYDNPDMKEFRDSSGLRLSYVNEKPDILAGIFDISQSISTMWIPPGAQRFRLDAYCQSECITKGMEYAGISETKVFGILFHSHLAGKSMTLRHFRDGKELTAFARDAYYDFNYQEAQYFEEPKILKSGDSLTLECDYTTLDRDVVTPGGLPTTSEMCIAFIMHYPPINMSVCGSRGKFGDPISFFKMITGLNITVNPTELVSLQEEMQAKYWDAMEIFSKAILDKVDWNDEKRKFAQNFLDNITLYNSCIDKRQYLMDFYGEFNPTRKGDYVDKNPICLPEEMNSNDSSLGARSIGVITSSAFLIILVAARMMLKN